jgi:4-hydroxybenzoate polyprenyltransferase
MSVLPRDGYCGRLRIYLAEMFPISRHLPMAVILAGSWLGLLGHLHGQWLEPLSMPVVGGAGSLFAILLALRLMDEFKDVDVDRALFAHRPVPSGRVQLADLAFTLRLVIGLFMVAHVLLLPGILWMATLLLGYALLMYRFFFVPQLLRRYLLLALVTHNPVVPVLLLYLVVLFADAAGMALTEIAWVPVLLLGAMYWLLLLSWELARKIRAPEDEDDYVTYSSLFGYRGAVSLTVALQTGALALAAVVSHNYELPAPFVPIVTIGYAIALLGHARFLLRPDTRTAQLRPFTEAYIMVACGAALPALCAGL